MATFTKAGSYSFQVTVTDSSSPTPQSVTSNVTVNVNQTEIIVVSLSPVTVRAGKTQSFSAVAKDQFGATLAVQPTFNWSTNVGAIDSSGLLTAQATVGAGTVTATDSSTMVSGNATVFTYTSTVDAGTAPIVSYVASGGPLRHNGWEDNVR